MARVIPLRSATDYRARARRIVVAAWFAYRNAAYLFGIRLDIRLAIRFCEQVLIAPKWLGFDDEDIDLLASTYPTSKGRISLGTLCWWVRREGYSSIF